MTSPLHIVKRQSFPKSPKVIFALSQSAIDLSFTLSLVRDVVPQQSLYQRQISTVPPTR